MSHLDTTFAALSNTTRRAILSRLATGETRLSDLAAPFDMSQTAVSKHVRYLEDAGLVEVEKRGRVRHCRLNASAMKEASHWLRNYEKFWIANLDSLAKYLADEEKEK